MTIFQYQIKLWYLISFSVSLYVSKTRLFFNTNLILGKAKILLADSFTFIPTCLSHFSEIGSGIKWLSFKEKSLLGSFLHLESNNTKGEDFQHLSAAFSGKEEYIFPPLFQLFIYTKEENSRIIHAGFLPKHWSLNVSVPVLHIFDKIFFMLVQLSYNMIQLSYNITFYLHCMEEKTQKISLAGKINQ